MLYVYLFVRNGLLLVPCRYVVVEAVKQRETEI